MSLDRVSVHGTELLAQDLRDTYRQKLARITLDSMVQFVGLLDAQGIVLEINKVALDAVGLKLADVEGKPFWTTFWWQVSPEANEGIRDAIARAGKGESVRWDTSLYASPDGSTTIVIDASVTPVKDEQGKVVFLACEGRDITEKKAYEREIARQREELARLDELKTEFFANISHEFRTPLTLMLGPLEDALADTTDLSSANRERLTLAHRNAVRQFKLVNTLLDFSRIEAGRIDSSFEPADLPQLTAGLASVWRSAIERAGLELVVDCPPLVDPVYVDREMWEKIVLNLISNAFKFTFEGRIEVSLRATDGLAELTVRDTGTGIAEAEAPRIFDRFHRVREARSRSFEGSGIGLSLVRDLARLHGGDVGVQSEVGRGSCFRVTVPLGKDHLPADRIGAARTLGSTASRADAYVEEALHWLPEETRRGSEPVEAELEQLAPGGGNPSGGRAPARVLLVDDNSDMRAYVCRLLVQSGFEVDTASDGWSALELARERRPDLVLSDIMMPGLDGFGLLRELRADAELAEVPLIMLSARAGEEARIEGVQAGADDYLVKPFGARELLARVDAQFKMTHFRRTSGAKLYESENRFRALALASSDVIYTMSPDWKEMKHLQGRELIADTLEPSAGWMQRYIHPDDQPGVQACIDEAIRTKEVFELEHRVLRADGSFGWTFSRAIPILGDDGTITEWFGMARDVTERRRLEASLRSADRRKDEFLATLAHELRNPLAPIRNAVELLKLTESADSRVQAARDIVDRQVRHMVRLVDDLLEVSRITLGQVTLRRETLSLRSVLADALEAAGPAIWAGTHAVSVQLPPDALHIDGDVTRLSQVFQNILHNAAKYTPAGGQITVLAERVGDEARVSIRDTGVGIPEELHSRVFELFTRVHPDDREKTTGLGIGLALAKQLVGLHGGRLELLSDGAGTGSEFVVWLPAKLATAAAAPVEVAPVSRLRPDGQRVLVVDDNRDAAESLEMLLNIDGYSVKVAADGASALRAFEDFGPQILLLDIGLPDIDGYELARRIRATPEGERLLIIALTGWGQAEDKRRAGEAGFDQHLTKPIDPRLLSELLGGASRAL